jgi:hypothetical protein
VVIFSSCTDLDQVPEDRLSPETYFTSEAELEQYTNSFYSLEPQEGDFKWFGEQSELIQPSVLAREIMGSRALPSSSSDVGWTWTTLRNINYYLQNSGNCTNTTARNHYDGVAYFFRAFFYYGMLTKFGEVPWYDQPIGSADTELLCKPRDSRDVIINHIIEDCDKAYELLLPTGKKTTEVCAWTALALKSRATLFEGTFRKYHAGTVFNPESLSGDELLKTCAEASLKLMNEGGYSLYTEGSEPYRDLFATIEPRTDEVIWARIYGDQVGGKHNANDDSKTRMTSMTKRFANLFLMTDGTPFTDRADWQTVGYLEECQNRDPRMAQTILCPGYIQKGQTTVQAPAVNITQGCYQYIKYVMSDDYDAYNQSRASLPIFRLAEIYLNYAEALAELGTLTQNDLDISVNKLRDRVGMPHLNLAYANAHPDSYLMSEDWGYPNVTKSANTGVILEVRRERLVELSLELVHYNDILRWREGKVYEKPFYGIYYPGEGKYDTTGDGKNNICIYSGKKPSGLGLKFLEIGTDIVLSEGDHGFAVRFSSDAFVRTWREERDYLYGIPTNERLLSGGALTQNPGWNDGLSF